MGEPVGTLAWLRRTGGRLSPRDRLWMLGEGVLYQLRELTARAGSPGAATIEHLAAIRVPDTPAAIEATRLCAEASTPTLFHHSMRTYFWGALLAARSDLRYDAELLYTSCLLHDLGLTAAHSGARPETQCFTVDSVDAASRFAEAAAWAPARSRQLAEAIALHLNPRVPPAAGAEAHLLHAGAALDVVGARWHEIAPGDRDGVLAAHPRLGAKQALRAAMAAESAAHPAGRMAMLWRVGGMGGRIARAPYEE